MWIHQLCLLFISVYLSEDPFIIIEIQLGLMGIWSLVFEECCHELKCWRSECPHWGQHCSFTDRPHNQSQNCLSNFGVHCPLAQANVTACSHTNECTILHSLELKGRDMGYFCWGWAHIHCGLIATHSYHIGSLFLAHHKSCYPTPRSSCGLGGSK